MAAERRQFALTDDKTLDTEHTSSTQTPMSNLSRRSSQVEKLQQDEPEPALERTISGIIPPKGDAEKQTATSTATAHPDPNIVEWEENDPDNPQNWTVKKKWGNMGIVSAICFLTPLASSMVAPGVSLIMRDFHSTNQTIGSFVVSIYVLGYALGPLFIAPMSEVYGRMPVYHICNAQFVIWSMACALAPNMGALLAFRLLAGIAGSCPITIGGGSIADVFDQKSRGAAMALFALGPLLGPVIGPVAGGFLSQAEGWRWVFWVLTIAVGSGHFYLCTATDYNRVVWPRWLLLFS
jgi:multidrug resistance protein